MDISDLKEKLGALGVDPSNIDGVIESVMDFVKDKLPDNMAGILDSVVSGDGDGPDLGDAVNKLKGLFGG